ncbi:hypothetical protein DM860_003005 [Cuscuta australis]|uniref:Uncharacterized protein n=1 Tax=Cuscuta australis TaxID=267555 RepID=A0A328D138_9ASTE|nr:hypothetical protein DM860_003005 [Cuscuta australis]
MNHLEYDPLGAQITDAAVEADLNSVWISTKEHSLIREDASNGKLNQTIAEPKGDQAEKDNLTTAELTTTSIICLVNDSTKPDYYDECADWGLYKVRVLATIFLTSAINISTVTSYISD